MAAPSAAWEGNRDMDDRVRRTIDLLENLGYRSIPVSRLAAAVGLGGSRLSHLFKRDTKLSIRSFVKQRRLEHATELIATTDERISEILYSVGFTDAANFDHAFKLEYGVCPREYRHRVRSTRPNSAATPSDVTQPPNSL